MSEACVASLVVCNQGKLMRKNMTRWMWFFWSCMIGGVVGCGSTAELPVVEIGEHKISAVALQRFYHGLAPGLRADADVEADAARLQYVQALIDRRLLLIEAQASGVDTVAQVRDAVFDLLENRIIYLYTAREVNAKAKVSEEEVRQHFSEGSYNRKRQVSAILVKERTQIDSVVKALAEGAVFEELARLRSLDRRSGDNGGDLGFVGRDLIKKLYIPTDLFINMPAGEVSRPLRAGTSWHVVRFGQEEATVYGEYRHIIEETLIQKRLTQVEEELIEALEAEFKMRLQEPGLQEMLDAYGRRDIKALETSKTPIYQYDQGAITVAQVQQALKKRNLRLSAERNRALAVLEKRFLRSFLFAKAARRDGLHEDPAVQRYVRQRREDTILETFRSQVLNKKVQVADEEVRNFYDNRPEFFHHERATWIEELLLSSEAEAHRVKAQITKGALFEDLIGLSLRQGMVEDKARLHLHPREKGVMPRLFAAIQGVQKGELGGPVEVDGGFSVFRVLFQEEDNIESFETAKKRARALLIRERENRLLTSQVHNLRQQSHDQITIHKDRLKVALPDSLIAHAD